MVASCAAIGAVSVWQPVKSKLDAITQLSVKNFILISFYICLPLNNDTIDKGLVKRVLLYISNDIFAVYTLSIVYETAMEIEVAKFR